MGAIGDSIEAALQAASTRPLPASPTKRMEIIVRAENGSTKRAAARLGCSQRQVERYLKGEVRRPTPRLAAALEGEARRDWQPRVRQRAIRRAGQVGITVETRARFGFRAAAGSTDDARMRRITEQIDPWTARALLAAYQAGKTEDQLSEILAEGLAYAYFQDRGRRAAGLDVTMTDIDYLDVELG
ncbi:telomere-protecting terminal protein Tpg [Streptomyces boetiae]|uniref:telomere-protecting terminal protein Tpg n=1 Tax=Streptomyces boetiae TaxID=3075541 RepID=UPI00374E08FB